MQRNRNNISARISAVVLPIIFILLCATVLSSVYATNSIRYTNDRTQEPVADSFEAAVVTCEVVKGNDGAYTVTNTGNVAVYLRVLIAANWVNADGSVHYRKPVIAVETDETWLIADDGYVYYKIPLEPEEYVTLTVAHNDNTDPCPVNTVLDINFIAEVIQSKPSGAIQDAWGIIAYQGGGGDLQVGIDEFTDFGELNAEFNNTYEWDESYNDEHIRDDDDGIRANLGNMPGEDYEEVVTPALP